MSEPIYMVTGASGQLGRLVLTHLRRRVPEKQILGLVRREEDAEALRVQGFGARLADYTDRDGLSEALYGVDRLLLVSGSAIGQRVGQHRNVIEAAKGAGVGFMAYTSILDAQDSPMMLAEEHKATEDMIDDSGLDYVLLRNGWYSENILASLKADLKLGKHFGAAGEGRFSTAPRNDYAEAAANVLVAGGPAGKIYELAGDTAFTLSEFAAMLSRISGKAVAYVNAEETAFKAALVQAGLPEAFAAVLANSDANAAEGTLYSDSKDLSGLLGRPTEPMEETIRKALEE